MIFLHKFTFSAKVKAVKYHSLGAQHWMQLRGEFRPFEPETVSTGVGKRSQKLAVAGKSGSFFITDVQVVVDKKEEF